MAETETPLDPEYSPPLFEPDQSDDYTRYLLHSKAEILAVLRALINKGAMITVHFDQGHSFLLTSMIALSTDHNQIILDLGSNEEMNKRALQATKQIFSCRSSPEPTSRYLTASPICCTKREISIPTSSTSSPKGGNSCPSSWLTTTRLRWPN